jgi:anti-sigma regulatory factor (Ser/Thr protein kinase)
MHRVWEIDGGDYGSASRARKEFAAYIRRAGAPEPDCQAAILIFGELVANALTHGRGTVQASVCPGAPYAVLWVEDAGEGFTLDHVQQPVRGQLGGRGILIAKSLARSIHTARVGHDRFRVTVELPVQLPV